MDPSSVPSHGHAYIRATRRFAKKVQGSCAPVLLFKTGPARSPSLPARAPSKASSGARPLEASSRRPTPWSSHPAASWPQQPGPTRNGRLTTGLSLSSSSSPSAYGRSSCSCGPGTHGPKEMAGTGPGQLGDCHVLHGWAGKALLREGSLQLAAGASAVVDRTGQPGLSVAGR